MDSILPFFVGLITGILSGFGVGGGTILLIYLTAIAGVDQHTAQGINLLYFLPAGILALPSHIKNDYIEKAALVPAIFGGLIFAAVGALFATKLDADILHKCFGGFLVLIGLGELFSKNEKET